MASLPSCEPLWRSPKKPGLNETVTSASAPGASATSGVLTANGCAHLSESVSGSVATFLSPTFRSSGAAFSSPSACMWTNDSPSGSVNSISGSTNVAETAVEKIGLPPLALPIEAVSSRTSSTSPAAAHIPRTTKMHDCHGSRVITSGDTVKTEPCATPTGGRRGDASPSAGAGAAARFFAFSLSFSLSFDGLRDALLQTSFCGLRPLFSRTISRVHSRFE